MKSSVRRRAVLLINLGTPDAPDSRSVRRYLAEFLSDPEVIRFPRGLGWMTPVVGRLIAFFRAKGSAKLYREIWTEAGSPLRVIVEQQSRELEQCLPPGWSVFHAMRYGQPSIPKVLAEIAKAGISEVVVVPMYPQFSGPTTRTALRCMYDYMRSFDSHLDITIRGVWFNDVGYIKAQSQLIADWADKHDLDPTNCFLLFSAHSLPVAYVRRGDPYQRQIEKTREFVLDRLGWPAERSGLAFQSRLGPVEWLSPNTGDALERLAGAGERNVLICPLSFTADCIETLEEIDRQYRHQFESQGTGRRLVLCPALNDFEPFIAALRQLVLLGPHILTETDVAHETSEPSSALTAEVLS